MLPDQTTGENFTTLAEEMENEKVWKCEILTLGHTYEGGPSELIDMCHRVKNPNRAVRRLKGSNASFRFGSSKFRGVSKETVTNLKTQVVGAGKTGNATLVLASSKTNARGNNLHSMLEAPSASLERPRISLLILASKQEQRWALKRDLSWLFERRIRVVLTIEVASIARTRRVGHLYSTDKTHH